MPVITVSKESGCGDYACMAAAKILGYRYFSKEMVYYVATIAGMSTETAKHFDEENYSYIYSLLSEFLDLSIFCDKGKKLPEMTADEYARRNNIYAYASTESGQSFFQAMKKIIHMLANEGNVIIVGRGGNFLLKDHPDTLHIRLVAPLSLRADNISKSMAITTEEAAKHSLTTDKKKKKFIHDYYGHDVANPLNYNMLLNLGMLDTEQAAEIIASSVKPVAKTQKA